MLVPFPSSLVTDFVLRFYVYQLNSLHHPLKEAENWVYTRRRMTGVDLRPATPADEPFLRSLMTRTMADELGAWAWPEAIRADLLQKQSQSRLVAMRSTWRGLDDRIISADGQPVGRIALAFTADEVWIVDLTVLPENRNGGVGTAVLRSILDEARRLGKPVRLHVNMAHRASRFYERLGFVKAGGSDVHQLMEWTPVRYATA